MATRLNTVDVMLPREAVRPGLVDRFLAFVDNLPGPAMAWSVVFAIALSGVMHGVVWASAVVPVGRLEQDLIVPAVMLSYFAWLLQTLNRVGAAAFDEFRPALGGVAADQDWYRRVLTSIPDRIAVITIVVVVVFVTVAYYVAVRPARPVQPLLEDLLSGAVWELVAAAIAIVIVHTVRQLRLVSRLSEIARNVDVFKPAPTNALSRLTAVTSVGLLAFVALFVATSPDQQIVFIVEEAALIALAAAAFVLPLRVMHHRLTSEKKRLVGESQDRLKAVLSDIHRMVDASDHSASEQLHHSLSTVLAEQDVLQKLHTWPWSTATIRGFASALLVPIGLIVFTQLIDRFL